MNVITLRGVSRDMRPMCCVIRRLAGGDLGAPDIVEAATSGRYRTWPITVTTGGRGVGSPRLRCRRRVPSSNRCLCSSAWPQPPCDPSLGHDYSQFPDQDLVEMVPSDRFHQDLDHLRCLDRLFWRQIATVIVSGPRRRAQTLSVGSIIADFSPFVCAPWPLARATRQVPSPASPARLDRAALGRVLGPARRHLTA